MKGRNQSLSKIAPRAALTAAAAVLFSAITACDDEPYYERQDRWRWVTYLPEEAENYTAVTEGAGGDVYVSGQDTTIPEYPRAVVYGYDGSGIREEFRAPYDNAAFLDMESAGGVLWAAGTKSENYEYRPCVFKREGGKWNEVPVPPSVDESAFTGVLPISAGSCWFETRGGVYACDAGSWRKVFARDRRVPAYDFAVTAGGRAFAYAAGSKTAAPMVYVSDDGGATWVAEALDLGTKMYDFYGSACSLAAAGEGLFLTVRLTSTLLAPKEAPVFLGVIARDDAPPGRGTYEISYVGSLGLGGGYGGWRSAFRTSGEGYVVGYALSLAREGGMWHPENTSRYFDFIALTVGRDTYWALVEVREYGGSLKGFYLYRVE